MKKSIFILDILIFSIFVLSFLSPSAIAATSSSVATKDSFVYEGTPDDNYGTDNNLMIGNQLSYLAEGYIGFDTSSPPSGWTTAEVLVDLYEVIAPPMQLTVSLITAIWDELTITWNNKPVHDQEITQFTVTAAAIYTINVTNFISGNTLSICLNATTIPPDHSHIASREDITQTGLKPTLIWTYPTTEPVIPGFIFLFLFGTMLGTCICIIKKIKIESN